MILSYSSLYKDDFFHACNYEHVFGSKIRSALLVYGIKNKEHRFFLATSNKQPTAALYLKGTVLTISANANFDIEEFLAFLTPFSIKEIDSNFELCTALQEKLGGTLDSSYYMVYQQAPPIESFKNITSASLPAVFELLQKSHEYYRTHLIYESWTNDLTYRIQQGSTKVYQLTQNGEMIATGSLYSQDETSGILAEIAVLPKYRHQGFGSYMTRFLVQKVCSLGKTPRLIAGYDEVAELYRKVGFDTCGRFGELYF